MTTRKLAVAMSLASGLVMSGLMSPARAEENQFTIGSQWWTQTVSEAKYQEFREVPRGGFLESFMWSTWSGRNNLSIWGANGLQLDQATKLSLSNGVKWRLDVGYAQIPHLFSMIAHSPYAQGVPGYWMLPDSLQAKNQSNPSKYTANMQDLLNNSPVIPMNFSTNTSTARLRARPMKDFQVEARGSLRERSGVKPYAMTFGFSTAIEIPEPIHQRMADGDLIVNYQKDKLKLMASGGVSMFKNQVSTMLVDNPKRITDINGGDGPVTGAMDLYPDNHVIRGSLALAYLMSRSTALAATFGMSQGTQDDPFMKPTSNKALAQSTLDSLPARSLAGKANTMNGDVRLASTLARGLQSALRVHYTKYDNKTPTYEFTGFAPYDVSWQKRIYTENDPVGNSQTTAGADLDYSLSRMVKVGGTAEYRIRERTFREIEKDKETVLGARAVLRPIDAMQVDGKYTHGDRKNDGFNVDDYTGYTTRLATPVTGVYDSLVQVEQADLRRFDVADRVQDKAAANVSYSAGENLDLTASYAYRFDDYKQTKLGLENDKEHTVAAAGTYHLNDRVDLNGSYGFDWVMTNQASIVSNSATLSTNPLNAWTAELKDNDNFAQVGFDWDVRPQKFSMVGDYQFSRHFATFHFTSGDNLAQDLPSTIYRLHQATVEGRYYWLKTTTILVRYGWEEYDTNDWATTNVPYIFPTTGTSNAVFFGDSSRGYIAHRVALMMKHVF
jgi:MtrB/PioB family decaheme-associated outer membrane protein